MHRSIGVVAIALLLAACASPNLAGAPSPGHLTAASARANPATIPRPLLQTVPLPRPRSSEKTETYSVVVHNIKVDDLIFALARDAKLNVDIHPGLAGTVSMNAIDQTLPQLLNRIARQVDLRFELDGPNLAVMPDTPYLRNYKIDYVNMARDATGTVATNTQISTSAVAANVGGPAGGGNTSRIQIDNRSRNRFWESLERNIKELLHETDKVFPEGSTETVMEQNTSQSTTGTGAAPQPSSRASAPAQNLAASPNPATLQNTGATVVRRMTFREAASVIASPEAGIVTVRATSRQHEKVQEFVERVMTSARRQVLIEATIVEVTLSQGYQQGIEWNRITDNTAFSITRPTVTSNVPSNLSPYVFKYSKINPLSLLTTVELLRSFGTVKVLSSPKLSVLNNQTATLKVSEDYVYFNVKSDTTSTANVGTTVGVTTTPQSVAVGFFMSLTAQIGDNDTVTLNIRPSISSISDLKRDPNPIIPKDIPNFIPQIRTREIESLMRIESGDIAVLGGLMEDRIDNRGGRVPGLGDLPIIGEIFNTRANATSKSELVVLLRPTVIKDASLSGDFADFAGSLPDANFFSTDKVYQPFSGPAREPLQ